MHSMTHIKEACHTSPSFIYFLILPGVRSWCLSRSPSSGQCFPDPPGESCGVRQFRQDIIPPASGGSTLGSSPSWTSHENHIREVPWRHHNLISEPPQLSSFDMKKQSVYSGLFPDVRVLSLWSHLWVQSFDGGHPACIAMLILVTTWSWW